MNSNIKNNNTALKQDLLMVKRGIKIEKLYGGYFGSIENCKTILPHIPKSMFSIKNIAIVDAGSSEGTLGIFVRNEFIKHGGNPYLVLVDTNATSLENSTADDEKIVADFRKRTPLERNSINIVLLRSVLQYVDPEDQESILKEIYRILTPGGILISQHGSFANRIEAGAFNGIFKSFGRKVYFHEKSQWLGLHKKVFGDISIISQAPTLYESMQDFTDRINASHSEVLAAEGYISRNRIFLENVLTKKEATSAWKIPFITVSCHKTT